MKNRVRRGVLVFVVATGACTDQLGLGIDGGTDATTDALPDVQPMDSSTSDGASMDAVTEDVAMTLDGGVPGPSCADGGMGLSDVWR